MVFLACSVACHANPEFHVAIFWARNTIHALTWLHVACREYTKEAEDFFQNPPPSANAGKASPSDNDDIEEDEAESSADERPVLSLGRGRSRLRAR